MGSEKLVIPDLGLPKINTKQKLTTESPRAGEVELEPVTPAGRLFQQPNLNLYILCTLGFENPINVCDFKTTLSETLAKHKRFHSIISKDSKGTDVWVPVTIDINAHVFEPTGYMEPEIRAAPRFVEDYLSDLAYAPPIDASRPLWECHILNGTSGIAKSHMVVRIHHTLGDGTSLMSLLLACTRRLGKPDELPSIPEAKRRKREMKFKGNSTLGWILSTVILFWNTLVGIFLFTSTGIWLKDSDSALKGHEGVEKMKKKIAYQIFDIDDMRVVKDAVNGTINDVLMGMVGAGLLRYLENKSMKPSPIKSADGENHGEIKKNSNSNVENLRIRALTLLNTRRSPGLQELVLMMEGGSQMRWGNHLGYLLIQIPMKHQEDPLDHVLAAKKIGDKKKASLEGIFAYRSGALLMKIAGPIPAMMLTRRVALQTTLSVSNVPGPTEPVMFSGNPIVSIYPTGVGHPAVRIQLNNVMPGNMMLQDSFDSGGALYIMFESHSLAIYLQSYMGKASLVCTTAEDVIPDPEVICQHCVDSLKNMVKSARQRGSGKLKAL